MRARAVPRGFVKKSWTENGSSLGRRELIGYTGRGAGSLPGVPRETPVCPFFHVMEDVEMSRLASKTHVAMRNAMGEPSAANELLDILDEVADQHDSLEIVSLDEVVTLTNAVADNLSAVIPAGAVILYVGANLDTLVEGDGTGDDGLLKVGIGPSGDPDKYGKTTVLTKNAKVTTIPDWAVLASAETIRVNAVDTNGAIVTEKFVAGGEVHVRVTYLKPRALSDKP